MRSLLLSLSVATATIACTGAPAPEQASPEQATAKTETETHEASKATAEADKPTKAEVGKAAPDFTLTDLDGKEHSLAAYKGKPVVLEWFNPGCPFVVAAHSEGPLKDMAATYMGKDVVWLSINSGAPGKQGHGVETNQEAAAEWGMSNPVLVDESGTVGKMYGARTTPHMFVIDAESTLVYAGGLDNAPRNEKPESGYIPFTAQAIDAVLAGEDVKTSKSQAWGCSVKYGA